MNFFRTTQHKKSVVLAQLPPSSAGKMQQRTPERKKSKRAEREPRRKLVRWNDKLDQLLLLAVDYVCKQNGIKIPYGEVAKVVGPEATAGAVEQHLGKLRKKRQDNGEPVPPLPKGSRGEKVKTGAVIQIPALFKSPKAVRASGRQRNKRINYNDDDSSASGFDPDTASDMEGDYENLVASREKRGPQITQPVKYEPDSAEESPSKRHKAESSEISKVGIRNSEKKKQNQSLSDLPPATKLVKLKINPEVFGKPIHIDSIHNGMNDDTKLLEGVMNLPLSDSMDSPSAIPGLETNDFVYQDAFLKGPMSSGFSHNDQTLHLAATSFPAELANPVNTSHSVLRGFQFTEEPYVHLQNDSRLFADEMHEYSSSHIRSFDEQTIMNQHPLLLSEFETDSSKRSSFNTDGGSKLPSTPGGLDADTPYDSFRSSFQYPQATPYGYSITPVPRNVFRTD